MRLATPAKIQLLLQHQTEVGAYVADRHLKDQEEASKMFIVASSSVSSGRPAVKLPPVDARYVGSDLIVGSNTSAGIWLSKFNRVKNHWSSPVALSVGRKPTGIVIADKTYLFHIKAHTDKVWQKHPMPNIKKLSSEERTAMATELLKKARATGESWDECFLVGTEALFRRTVAGPLVGGLLSPDGKLKKPAAIPRTEDCVDFDIALSSKSTVLMVFVTRRKGKHQLWTSLTADKGKTWTVPHCIHRSQFRIYCPRVVVTDDILWMAFAQDGNSGKSELKVGHVSVTSLTFPGTRRQPEGNTDQSKKAIEPAQPKKGTKESLGEGASP